MRVLRRIAGIALIMVGVPLLLVGVAGVLATGHTDEHGAFTAVLEPVHSTGYAVVVPDVDDLLSRHRGASLLSPGRLRVTVSASDAPVMLVVVPADAALTYLDGAARTEVTAVRFASGAQPVNLTDLPGGPVTRVLPAAMRLASGTDVVWDPADQHGRVALLVMRTDGEPGIGATLTVGIRAGWLVPVARGLMLAGGLALIGGWLVLLWRAPRQLTLVVEPEQLIGYADQLRDWVLPLAQPAAARFPSWALRDRSTRELTGELVTVPRPRPDRPDDPTQEEEMTYDHGEYERASYDRAPHEESEAIGSAPEEAYEDETAGRLRTAAARARRWGDRLRNRARNAEPARHARAGRSAVDAAEDEDGGDGRGESPYIHTAT